MLPPKRFKTVKQPPGSKLCGACVVAMAVGKPLKYATDRMHASIHPGDGLPWYRERELYAFLGHHGIMCGLFLMPVGGEYFLHDKLKEDVEITVPIVKQPAIAVVKSDTFEDGNHWVFWDGKHIRDPQPALPNLRTLKPYEFLQWTPLTYIDEGAEERWT